MPESVNRVTLYGQGPADFITLNPLQCGRVDARDARAAVE
jgi:hypothetical protein